MELVWMISATVWLTVSLVSLFKESDRFVGYITVSFLSLCLALLNKIIVLLEAMAQ